MGGHTANSSPARNSREARAFRGTKTPFTNTRWAIADGKLNFSITACTRRRFGDVDRKLVIHTRSAVEFVRQVVAKCGE